MGIPTFERECGPDGQTIVHLHATNSWTDVYVDGVHITDQNGDGTADVDTVPGYHTIIWYGPATNGDGTKDPTRIVELNRVTIEIPALTNCAAPPTTLLPVPSTISETTGTTALVPPSTNLQGACPGGCTTIPPAIDQGDTVCTEQPTACIAETGTPPALPATGFRSDAAIGGGVALVLGAVLVAVAHRRTQREIRRIVKARVQS